MMQHGAASDRAKELFDAVEPLIRTIQRMIRAAPLAEDEKLEAALMVAVASTFPVANLTKLDLFEDWEAVAALITRAAKEMMPLAARDALRACYAAARRLKRAPDGASLYGAEVAPLLYEAGLEEGEAADCAAAIWADVSDEADA